MGTIQIKQAGMLTTVQDLGRWGFGRFGMPVAGVMDEYAARVANILLGNKEKCAGAGNHLDGTDAYL